MRDASMAATGQEPKPGQPSFLAHQVAFRSPSSTAMHPLPWEVGTWKGSRRSLHTGNTFPSRSLHSCSTGWGWRCSWFPARPSSGTVTAAEVLPPAAGGSQIRITQPSSPGEGCCWPNGTALAWMLHLKHMQVGCSPRTGSGKQRSQISSLYFLWLTPEVLSPTWGLGAEVQRRTPLKTAVSYHWKNCSQK